MEAEGVAGSSVYIPPPDPLLPPAFDQPLPNMRLRSLSDGATAWRFSCVPPPPLPPYFDFKPMRMLTSAFYVGSSSIAYCMSKPL